MKSIAETRSVSQENLLDNVQINNHDEINSLIPRQARNPNERVFSTLDNKPIHDRNMKNESQLTKLWMSLPKRGIVEKQIAK